MKKGELFLGLTRISLGLVFIWAFVDKIFGFGFATNKMTAWINGGSPTYGFLAFGIRGPLTGFYQWLAHGSFIIDWIFMIGLLLIGLALIFGVTMNLAGYSGALLMVLMYSALLPPEHHPFIDEHIIYALVLIAMAGLNAGDYLGFGKQWRKYVNDNKWLK